VRPATGVPLAGFFVVDGRLRMEKGIELFEHELKDIYDAENKLGRELESMAGKVTDEKLTKGLLEHKQQTESQITRLEEVFGLLDKKPSREVCHGINGLLKEFKSFVDEEDPSPELLDVFATGASLKVEHYEMAAYKSLIKLAEQGGLGDAVPLLEETLNEEQETAQKLEALSEQLGQRV
jgi:ferritin-like metal-binding protein YciE